jgi:hypothetical protein
VSTVVPKGDCDTPTVSRYLSVAKLVYYACLELRKVWTMFSSFLLLITSELYYYESWTEVQKQTAVLRWEARRLKICSFLRCVNPQEISMKRIGKDSWSPCHQHNVALVHVLADISVVQKSEYLRLLQWGYVIQIWLKFVFTGGLFSTFRKRESVHFSHLHFWIGYFGRVMPRLDSGYAKAGFWWVPPAYPDPVRGCSQYSTYVKVNFSCICGFIDK